MGTMTTMLVSFAELSNIFSILAVLICFCAMILFITRNMMVLRIHGEELVFPAAATLQHHHPGGPRIPQMNMMKVHIPFTFRLVETSKSSYAEVQCSVSSQVRYCVCAFWGTSIRELHVCLWKPWGTLRDLCLRGELLQGHCLRPGLRCEKRPHSDEVITLSLPSPPLELGTPPRLRYPLVIFLMRTDQDDQVHPDETVALINVVHIKDTVCTLPTSILAQYLKQANGQLSCLKQLYLATGNSANYDDETSGVSLALAEPVGDAGEGRTLLCEDDPSSPAGGGVWKSATEQLCVVCQYFPLSRALLPCRHTCICASCFDKLERCPMCRGPIKSYFCIRGEEYMPIQPPSQKNVSHGHGPLYNWLDSWNDRLTDFLGIHDIDLDSRYRIIPPSEEDSRYESGNTYSWMEHTARGLRTYVTIPRSTTLLTVTGLKDQLVETLPQDKQCRRAKPRRMPPLLEMRPVAVEPTDDGVAAGATVFVSLPGGHNTNVRLALTSSLILLKRQCPSGGRAFLRRRSHHAVFQPT